MSYLLVKTAYAPLAAGVKAGKLTSDLIKGLKPYSFKNNLMAAVTRGSAARAAARNAATVNANRLTRGMVKFESARPEIEKVAFVLVRSDLVEGMEKEALSLGAVEGAIGNRMKRLEGLKGLASSALQDRTALQAGNIANMAHTLEERALTKGYTLRNAVANRAAVASPKNIQRLQHLERRAGDLGVVKTRMDALWNTVNR